jgi:hypothetical protein
MKRNVWVVKTRHGFLGNRRYAYRDGTTTAKADCGFSTARVFTRIQDANGSCERGDEVVACELIIKN